MAFDDTFTEREADPGAVTVATIVRPLEDLKNLVLILQRYSDPLVSDRDEPVRAVSSSGNVNGRRLLAAVLDGVL